MKKDLLRIIALVGLAFVVAVVANAVAGRERKLVLPGYYPDPLHIPAGQRKPAAQPVEAGTIPPPAALPEITTAAPVTATEPATGMPVATATVTPAATSSTAPSPALVATTATATPVPHKASPSSAAVPSARAPAPMPVKEVSLTERFAPHPDKPYVEINYADAALLHARGALFLDARRTAVYKEGHIAGSRTFSVWESDVDEKVNGLFNERSNPEEQNQPIVIYCSGGACEDSHMLAQKLWGIEFNNVLVYKDGYPDWVKRGGATRVAQ